MVCHNEEQNTTKSLQLLPKQKTVLSPRAVLAGGLGKFLHCPGDKSVTPFSSGEDTVKRFSHDSAAGDQRHPNSSASHFSEIEGRGGPAKITNKPERTYVSFLSLIRHVCDKEPATLYCSVSPALG